MAPLNTYPFLGNAWTLWSAYDPRDGVRIVSGIEQASHAILSVCLIRKGEDPIHPDFGMAPELFEPLSFEQPEYWVYHAEQEIMRWVGGLAALQVRVSDYDNVGNGITTEIGFSLRSQPTQHILTFPFYQYQGAVMQGDWNPFIAAIILDGKPFVPLA
jgi:hypothetical protein